jgi:ClpP class serine protease
MEWLLEEQTLYRMRELADGGMRPTADEAVAFEKQVEARRSGGLVVAGENAEIRVEGILTKRPNWIAAYFLGGNTVYSDIVAALQQARLDPNVRNVSFVVDSPGGEVDGLFDVLAAIEGMRGEKAMSVRATAALSAAYAIAAAAGSIRAENKASRFGSIGVAVEYMVSDSIVMLTNSDSPDKRPDVRTPEGRAAVVRHLDAINELFVDAIARGRGNGLTGALVKAQFGRGATLLAGEAQRLGMIDGIAQPALRVVGGGHKQPTPVKGNATMNEDELRASHPQLYTALVDKGRQQGIESERSRVRGHLTLCEASGDMKTAFEAIRAGTELTSEIQAAHFAFAMKRRDQNARQADSEAAGAALNGTDPAAGSKDLGDLVVERMEARRKGAAVIA